ncbi:CDGSH iron-sulfur domain-containing protein 3, mitochondrial [Orchesella cincta]|uniref:CDGSH iron-sulfur domain-containing protein 3, mitochondrial n=1 Tax=Orchesella cincta TaxID=48709 RepID=A0A1D2NL79_ORCCI|nr:CDGSH iron-sulfur domain-containing protein 3, mitochondrial [Orchesella cincta]
MQSNKGKIYDKKPFKFNCIKGKSYMWCSCGWSKSQPFCDQTHRNPHYRITMRPVRFIAPETKEYIFCNCKQSSKRPFCDGTHKREEIQAAIRS